jgi:hypothetical protein
MANKLKIELADALAQPELRNHRIHEVRGEMFFSAQFPTLSDSGRTAMWALEVAFDTQHGQWGWRTGPRGQPRVGWSLVRPGDARCRDFARLVIDAIRREAAALDNQTVRALGLLARRPA